MKASTAQKIIQILSQFYKRLKELEKEKIEIYKKFKKEEEEKKIKELEEKIKSKL